MHYLNHSTKQSLTTTDLRNLIAWTKDQAPNVGIYVSPFFNSIVITRNPCRIFTPPEQKSEVLQTLDAQGVNYEVFDRCSV